MNSIEPILREFATPDEMFQTLAKDILSILPNEEAYHGIFSMVISGGRSPVHLHKLLVEQPGNFNTRWDKVVFFFSDERCVGPDDDSSNYAMAHRTLFSPLSIQKRKIFRIKGELKPNSAAIQYHEEINNFFNKEIPNFDLALLGMGTDGHTASLFPNTTALNIHDKFALSAGLGPDGLNRISMTYRSLNASKKIFVMVTGKDKKNTLDKALQDISNSWDFPIKGVHALEELTFYISP